MAQRSFYSVNQLCDRWNVCPRTVRNRISSGSIRAFKDGNRWRVPTEAVLVYEARLMAGMGAGIGAGTGTGRDAGGQTGRVTGKKDKGPDSLALPLSVSSSDGNDGHLANGKSGSDARGRKIGRSVK